MYNKTIIEFGFCMISCSTSSNNCLLYDLPVHLHSGLAVNEPPSQGYIMHLGELGKSDYHANFVINTIIICMFTQPVRILKETVQIED